MSGKPKRPLAAYMLWLNNARDQVKRESPGIRVTGVAKKGEENLRPMEAAAEFIFIQSAGLKPRLHKFQVTHQSLAKIININLEPIICRKIMEWHHQKHHQHMCTT
ncbi:uncharacterized protein LOC129247887 [Anastrepha obliqua]|uniref:uncharacterized protein LOC129247887 n=1 Tax=Anastrepha obliqua TaxID=95512 RepID=UPI00240A7A60|nr:uncharacterized protein LOC129247887 [Anastrepha obliqua]